jgi:hypothetical protein
MSLLSGAPVLMCTEPARWRQCGYRGSLSASASSTSARFGCGVRKSDWSRSGAASASRDLSGGPVSYQITLDRASC